MLPWVIYIYFLLLVEWYLDGRILLSVFFKAPTVLLMVPKMSALPSSRSSIGGALLKWSREESAQARLFSFVNVFLQLSYPRTYFQVKIFKQYRIV